jgi:DNA repair exonuclease SbcCD ATPase subunit
MLEAQLRQSVPKKEHHEITSKFETEIDDLEKELDRIKKDLQKTVALNKQLGAMEEQLSNQNKTMITQGKVIDSLQAKLSQGTVPTSIHTQSLSKIRELEEERRAMVSRTEFASSERRCEELSRQISSMVPASEYISLRQRFEELARQVSSMVPASEYSALKVKGEELQNAISSMVPTEQLNSSEARVRELEARLAQHVPQTVYDELVSKVVSLAEEVTGGGLVAEGPEQISQPETGEAVGTAQIEATAPEPAEVPTEQVTVPEVQVSVTQSDSSVGDIETTRDGPALEIREIQSQLAEISSQTAEAKQEAATDSGTPGGAAPFNFSDTEVSVTSGLEFAQALERISTDVLTSHVQNGDFERWFETTLSDASTAESFRRIRENGVSGEELRTQVVSVAARFIPVTEAPIQSSQ